MRITPSLALIGSSQFGISAPQDCHVYAVKGPAGTVLIDAGAGTHTSILLASLGSELSEGPVTALLVTHAHLDHSGGAAGVRSKTGCAVIASIDTRPILETGDERGSGLLVARQQGIYPEELRFAPCPVSMAVQHKQQFEAGGLQWCAWRVRGHSEDSVCYMTDFDGHRWLFSGDAVFYGGVLGVINAEGSSMEGYREDLPALQGLNIDGLFPGHGLFTLRGAQRHIEVAVEQLVKGFLPRQIGQGDLIF